MLRYTNRCQAEMKTGMRNSKCKIQAMIGWKHDRAFPNMHIDGVLDLSASFDPSRGPILFTFLAWTLAAIAVGSRRKRPPCQTLRTNCTYAYYYSYTNTHVRYWCHDFSALMPGRRGFTMGEISTLGRLSVKDRSPQWVSTGLSTDEYIGHDLMVAEEQTEEVR